MKKPKHISPKHFVINTGIFKQDIGVFINQRSPEIIKRMEKYVIDPLNKEDSDWIDNIKIGTAGYLVAHKLIVLFPKNDHDLLTLFAHEGIHALHHILKKVGLGKMSNYTEETYAYLFEHMMDKFLTKAG